MTTADRIHEARRRKRMSQDHLARVAEVSVRTVRRVEAGEAISAENLRCLCAVLEIDAEEPVPPAPAPGPYRLVMPSAPLPASPFLHGPAPEPTPMPEARDYLRRQVEQLAEAWPVASMLVLLIFFVFVGGMTACVSALSGQLGLATFLFLQAALAFALCSIAMDTLEEQGLAIYRARAWAALAIGPANLLAWTLADPTRGPAGDPAGIEGIVGFLAFAGLPLAIGGAASLARTRALALNARTA